MKAGRPTSPSANKPAIPISRRGVIWRACHGPGGAVICRKSCPGLPATRHMCRAPRPGTVSRRRSHPMMAMLIFLLAASTEQQQKVAAAQWLLGSWKCEDTVGAFKGTYATTWSAALGEQWLRQSYEFPARDGKPPQQAEALMSYDPRRQY